MLYLLLCGDFYNPEVFDKHDRFSEWAVALRRDLFIAFVYRKKDSTGQKCFQRTREDISTVTKHTVHTASSSSDLPSTPEDALDGTACVPLSALAACVACSLCKCQFAERTLCHICRLSLWLYNISTYYCCLQLMNCCKCELRDVGMVSNPDFTTRAIRMKTAATRWPQSLTSESFAWNDHTAIIYMVYVRIRIIGDSQ